MTCCVSGCNEKAEHEIFWGRVCSRHLRKHQAITYEGHQRRQWASEHQGQPMPEDAKSKGLLEAEEIERQELMEIASPWIAIRKRKREAALERQVEEGNNPTTEGEG